MADPDPLAWRDTLPTAISVPLIAAEHPALVRALDQVHQHARIKGSILPWLGLSFALRDMGLTATPLPCLAGGAKAFRLKRRPDENDWLAVLRALEAAARIGLERLHDLERFHRDAQRAIVAQFRPGTLPRLLALAVHQPLLSPQAVANHLGLVSRARASCSNAQSQPNCWLRSRSAGAGACSCRTIWRSNLATPRRSADAQRKSPLPCLLVGRWSTHSILSIVRWRRSTSCFPGSFRDRRHRTEVGSQRDRKSTRLNSSH